jgi:hypothetical protein
VAGECAAPDRPSFEPVPAAKPAPASMSSRREGSQAGMSSAGASRWPRGLTTAVPDTTTVPERPW